MCKQNALLLMGMLALFAHSGANAESLVTPTHYPSNGSGAIYFDWQTEWGTIHMNSFADGLTDPGAFVRKDGSVGSKKAGEDPSIPCRIVEKDASGKPNICKEIQNELIKPAAWNVTPPPHPPVPGSMLSSNPTGEPPIQIDNGIKFDIKYSTINCMAKPIPNWPYIHRGAPDYSNGSVCLSKWGLQPSRWGTHSDEINFDIDSSQKTLIYLPVWDKRSNDENSEYISFSHNAATYEGPGCQQQVVNGCDGKDGKPINDIHSCKHSPPGNGNHINDGPGYLHPVTHAFYPDEVSDLGGVGAQLPAVYYHYKKITSSTAITGAENLPSDEKSYINVQEETVCAFETPEPSPVPDPDPSASPGPSPSPTSTSGSKKKCTTKYNYTRIDGSRSALAPVYPTDAVPGSVTEIKNGPDPILQRLKAYRIDMNESGQDVSRFITVDPSDFYDLKLYVPALQGGKYSKGKYDSGYRQFDSKGLVATYDSCPVLGLEAGYSGICDPTPDPEVNAGCNLPIYAEEAQTYFTSENGKVFTYTHYPIKWSGYARKWAWITREQYLQNVKSRGGIYLRGNEVNNNPILMVTRANDYCEAAERSSNSIDVVGSGAKPKLDMPCIQYLQYQTITNADGKSDYLFINLYTSYSPTQAARQPEYNVLRLYDEGADGKPNPSKPVAGSGKGIYIGVTGGTGYVSFLDRDKKYKKQDGQEVPAFSKVAPVLSTTGAATAGQYLGSDQTRGTGIAVEPGTASFVQLTTDVAIGGSTAPCTVITAQPGAPSNLFVPTNTAEEFQSFITAASAEPINGVSARSCDAGFLNLNDSVRTAIAAVSDTSIPTAQRFEIKITAADGTQTNYKPQTWNGMLRCDSLGDMRPQCNQTRMITARRYCQLENGSLGGCEACANVPDTDSLISFASSDVGGELLVSPIVNRCTVTAMCFNKSSTGCPSAYTSGGHVFCLAPDTKIAMADGTEKLISEIKAGEEVVSFDARYSRNSTLKKAKVKATAVTENQQILQINDLKITPLHKIVLASGRAVMAKEVKVGDKILDAQGLVVPVTSIKRDLAPITVYNLILEDSVNGYIANADGMGHKANADGYIANGVRVLSYPNLKSIDQELSRTENILQALNQK